MRRARHATLAALLLPFAAPAAEAPGDVFRDCDDCPEMVVVAAGQFVMGTPGARTSTGVGAAEADAVAITVARGFALGRLEVTRGQFARFIAASGHEPRLGCRTWEPTLGRFGENARRGWQDPATPAAPADDHPVTCLSFDDAQAYLKWLATKTGERYRLPSEAEWEFAARAGGRSARPWGEVAAEGCEQANTYDLTADAVLHLGWPQSGCRDGFPDLAPAGSLAPNAFGLHDLIGNVREWVQDCATGSYVGRPEDATAWEWLGCGLRVQRGGSWLTPPEESRSARRHAAAPSDRADDVGFRVARDLDARAAAGASR